MEHIYEFHRLALYEFDPNLIEIKNGVARLKKSYPNPVNQSASIAPTSSTSSAVAGELAKITNGDNNSWCDLGGSGPHEVTVDLGVVKTLRQIKVWGLFHNTRMYSDRIVRISENGSDWYTIFNNDSDNSAGVGIGTHSEYIETQDGKVFTIPDINAQYIQVWSGDDNLGGNATLVEIEAFESIVSVEPEYIKTKEVITANVLTDIAATDNLNGGTLKFNIIVDDVIYWWDGVSWQIVSEPDYFKTNTLVEIKAGWATFIETYAPRYFQFFIWFLSAVDGFVSPEINKLTLTFDLDPSVIPNPTKRLVYGYIYNADGSPREGVTVNATLLGVPRTNPRYDDLSGNAAFVTADGAVSITNQYGYFAFNLMVTDQFISETAKWKILTSDGLTKLILVDSSSLAPINLGGI